MSDSAYVEANIEQFMGFADLYDLHRPSLPPILVDLLKQYTGSARLRCVVDLGSGTGLSTHIWADHADEVVGIEPGDPMRVIAEKRAAGVPNLRFQKGLSTATGLPDGCADIVTAAQSLHWMEPVETLAEVARLLRQGGVFAVIDHEYPPIFNWEAEMLDQAFMIHAGELFTQGGYARDIHRWPRSQHLEQIQASGHFRYAKTLAIHHVESGDAERMVGLSMTQAVVQTLLKNGLTEEHIGIPAFRAEAKRILGDAPRPWYFTCRIHLAVK